MKKLIVFLFLIIIFHVISCTSTTKTDSSGNNTDTSYQEQPQDKTIVKDTALMQSDSMKHFDSIPH